MTSDNEHTDSYERLLNIIQYYLVCKEKLTRETVVQSFGIDGADTMELMDAIFEAFPIDWTEFKYHDYFYDEPPSGIGDKIELTIGELQDAIVAGVWKDPVPDYRKRLKGHSFRDVFISGIVALAVFWCLIAWALMTK